MMMRALTVIGLFLLSLCPVFGQLDDNTIAITASRPAIIQPDQAVLGIFVSAPPNTGLDDVLGLLSGLGLTASNLTGVSGGGGGQLATGVQITASWSFSLAVPFTKLNDVLATLGRIQKALTQPGSGQSGLVLTYSVQGTADSPELQAAHPCALPTLVSDARTQAQKVAAAAGFQVGDIVGISDVGQIAASFFPVLSVVRTGILGFSSGLGGFTALQPACSLTVQFRLQP